MGALALCRLRVQSTPTASNPAAISDLVRPAEPAQISRARGREMGLESIEGRGRLTSAAEEGCAGRSATLDGLLSGDSIRTDRPAEEVGPGTPTVAAWDDSPARCLAS